MEEGRGRHWWVWENDDVYETYQIMIDACDASRQACAAIMRTEKLNRS
jgi:hypothetical protein